jgi:predicted hydrocarbon binding protein
MALRAGRSWFAHGLHHFGALRGVADPAFRALPLEQRTLIGMQALAEVFTRFSDQSSRLIEQPGTFQFVVAHSPFAHRISAERPVCHLLVGVLQEALRWVSNGRDYSVRETHCVATGSENCIFVINRHPFA